VAPLLVAFLMILLCSLICCGVCVGKILLMKALKSAALLCRKVRAECKVFWLLMAQQINISPLRFFVRMLKLLIAFIVGLQRLRWHLFAIYLFVLFGSIKSKKLHLGNIIKI
jgi:hypothetical protein